VLVTRLDVAAGRAAAIIVLVMQDKAPLVKPGQQPGNR
jgi:hypothetical protein